MSRRLESLGMVEGLEMLSRDVVSRNVVFGGFVSRDLEMLCLEIGRKGESIQRCRIQRCRIQRCCI